MKLPSKEITGGELPYRDLIQALYTQYGTPVVGLNF